jgi:hypothetical protein
MVWGKKIGLPPLPYLYAGRGGGSAPLPRPFLRRVATWRRGVVRRLLQPCHYAMMVCSKGAVNRHIV